MDEVRKHSLSRWSIATIAVVSVTMAIFSLTVVMDLGLLRSGLEPLVIFATVAMVGSVALGIYLRPTRDRHEISLRDDVRILQAGIARLEMQIGAIESREMVSKEHKAELVKRLHASVKEDAGRALLDELRESIGRTDSERDVLKSVEGTYESAAHRLRREVSALANRGTANLILGFLIAVLGIAMLFYFVEGMKSSEGDPVAFVEGFLPRISVVMLIEVFAYFFLRLYSKSLDEIKHFQNEITNLEVRFMALRSSLHWGTERTVGEVIISMANTERNYVLRRGETALSRDQSKEQREWFASLAKLLQKRSSVD